jgi:hypothetical protein
MSYLLIDTELNLYFFMEYEFTECFDIYQDQKTLIYHVILKKNKIDDINLFWKVHKIDEGPQNNMLKGIFIVNWLELNSKYIK